MKFIPKISAITILMMAFTVQATAQQRQMMERNKTDRQEQMKTMRANQTDRHQNMMKMLDLTDTQREKIQEIHLNGQKSMLPLRNQMREHRAKLQTLTTGDNYDENAMNELVSEMSEIHVAMLTMRISHQQKIRQLLTEEQRIKFDTHQLRNTGQRNHKMKGMYK